MPVRAAAPLTFEDPAGDALDTRPSMDILKVTYEVRQVNRTGPPSLVTQLTLAAPPEGQLATYSMDAEAGPECFIDATYRPGRLWTEAGVAPAAEFYVGCGSDAAFVPAKMDIKDNVITLSVAMDSLPKQAREAGELTGLYAFSMTSEPALGLYGNGYIDGPGNLPTATDSATTDQTFKLA